MLNYDLNAQIEALIVPIYLFQIETCSFNILFLPHIVILFLGCLSVTKT